jgi:hypothetical protein
MLLYEDNLLTSNLNQVYGCEQTNILNETDICYEVETL